MPRHSRPHWRNSRPTRLCDAAWDSGAAPACSTVIRSHTWWLASNRATVVCPCSAVDGPKMPRPKLSTSDFQTGLARGDRALLAQAITLVESHRPADRAAADELLQAILPATGKAHRIGITGVPGVGKSTTID